MTRRQLANARCIGVQCMRACPLPAVSESEAEAGLTQWLQGESSGESVGHSGESEAEAAATLRCPMD
eukprot:6184896-Pleurochrysis_carterae.AAC.2